MLETRRGPVGIFSRITWHQRNHFHRGRKGEGYQSAPVTLYGKVGYPWWCGSLAVRTITKIPVAIKVRKDCGTAAVTF
ncbi:hypothetical protein MGG_16771 [Pyricularia oryzae 70-15]|uniref:Uncharacterized protein n=1 Tax=Pyricularia oryzae (strain 70-15 / ATCC MYA-4617 / FGSC 8958) TaxID=242507 RepID=G4N010_PYRO7|nr:uncharacterized protein MGG_16771 [Pyricularia oryzae 70-15]EHA52248.1 hypothetical protein MGG_16771 [Pyricularia oryzae 70-15]